VGFFYLVGHGIDDGLIHDALKVSRRFFALPEQDKLAIEMVNSPHFRGYNRAGYEHTRGKPDWREQVDIGPERPALPSGPDAAPWDRLQGPNQWPAAFPSRSSSERVTTRRFRCFRCRPNLPRKRVA
jgi:isopenicillin N synthase-like dioxygenase